MNVQQKRARCIGGVGGVRPAAGQSPDEEAVDRAECEIALLGKRARVLDIVEQPGDLRRRKIGVEQKPRPLGDHALEALRLELGALRRSAPILPDDGIVNRLARLAIPDERRFPLIGDADADQVFGATLRFEQRLASRVQHASPDVLRIVLHPSLAGENLREFPLRHRHRSSVGAEDDGASRCRALIDDENASLHAPRSLAQHENRGRALRPTPFAIQNGQPFFIGGFAVCVQVLSSSS